MNISVFGDSIMKGVILEEGRYVCSAQDRKKIEEQFGISADNCCKFGATIEKGITYARKKILAGGLSNITLIEFGGNDCDFDWAAVAASPEAEHSCKTPIADFKEIYRAFIREIRSAGSEPVPSTLPPISAERYLRWICRSGLSSEAILSWLGDLDAIYRWQERFSRCVEQIAAEEGCRLLDLRTAFLSEPRILPSLLCDDGIHPNRRGQELIYSEICAQLAV